LSGSACCSAGMQSKGCCAPAIVHKRQCADPAVSPGPSSIVLFRRATGRAR
jgi:hypothetical protein